MEADPPTDSFAHLRKPSIKFKKHVALGLAQSGLPGEVSKRVLNSCERPHRFPGIRQLVKHQSKCKHLQSIGEYCRGPSESVHLWAL
jgi:hypothetical protein